MTGIIKRSLIAAGVFGSVAIFAQQYTFDYLITTEQNHLNSETYHVYRDSNFTLKFRERPVNSKNPDIQFMFDRIQGNQLTAIIQDGPRKLRHYFKVVMEPLYLHTGFRLEYMRTERYKEKYRPQAGFTIEAEKPMVYDVKMDLTSTKRYHLTLKLTESEDDLLNLFIIDGAPHVEPHIVTQLRAKLDPAKKYMVSEYVIRYMPGSTFHKFNKAKRINFTVTLPKTKRVKKLMGM